MDIDKKRKIEEVVEPENLDLETVLKAYSESTANLLKVIVILTTKVISLEKVFNKDLFNKN